MSNTIYYEFRKFPPEYSSKLAENKRIEILNRTSFVNQTEQYGVHRVRPSTPSARTNAQRIRRHVRISDVNWISNIISRLF